MIAPRISSFAIATGCVMILALPGCDPGGDSNGGIFGPPGEGGFLPVPEVLSVRISS